MSYTESEITCDYCSGFIDNGGGVACKNCHEALEQKIGELEMLVEELRDRIALAELREAEGGGGAR